jgi:hypothetical protein
LDAYNIRILTVDTEEFFGVSHLPPPTVDPIILNNVAAPVGSHLSREIHLFFRFLRSILDPPIHNKDTTTQGDTSHVLDLSFHILRFLLHFSKPDRLILRCNILRFTVSRKQVRAKLDITLLDSENRILLILEEKVSSPLLPWLHTIPYTYKECVPSRPARAEASGQGSGGVSNRL